MIDLQGVRHTIEDIKRHGDSMEDLHDLAMLYQLEERMVQEGYSRAGGDGQEMSRADAEEWIAAMQNEDPSRPNGGKWTMEQVKPYAQKHGISTDGPKFFEFYAVMNAMYSDYAEVARRYSLGDKADFFADLARAFIFDKDAKPGKARLYYKTIVRK